jgi:hypothetical protein
MKRGHSRRGAVFLRHGDVNRLTCRAPS